MVLGAGEVDHVEAGHLRVPHQLEEGLVALLKVHLGVDLLGLGYNSIHLNSSGKCDLKSILPIFKPFNFNFLSGNFMIIFRIVIFFNCIVLNCAPAPSLPHCPSSASPSSPGQR